MTMSKRTILFSVSALAIVAILATAYIAMDVPVVRTLNSHPSNMRFVTPGHKVLNSFFDGLTGINSQIVWAPKSRGQMVLARMRSSRAFHFLGLATSVHASNCPNPYSTTALLTCPFNCSTTYNASDTSFNPCAGIRAAGNACVNTNDPGCPLTNPNYETCAADLCCASGCFAYDGTCLDECPICQ
jgi:hypothetical protein